MSKEIINNIIMTLFSILFLYTGMSKLINFEESRVSLTNALIIGKLGNVVAVVMPTLEILIALTIFIPKFELLALKTSFILMVIFTLYVGYLVLFAKSIPCSCGGIMHQMTWRQHLVFNIVFTFLAYWAIRNKSSMVRISNTNRLNDEAIKI